MVRIALLSSREMMAESVRMPRSFARLGGRTILKRQLDFALSLGCERIICLSDGLQPELVELQHETEDRGGTFHPIRDARPLAGLITASDDVLVIADGLAFDEMAARTAMGEGRKVLTLSAEEAVSAGFERIDRERAWAGVMRISGALAERLSDMPADVDPQSSLLRLALQAGTGTSAMAGNILAGHRWAIIDHSGKRQDFEDSWIEKSVAKAPYWAPVSAMADRVTVAVLRRHAQPAKAVRAVGAVAFGLVLVSGLCGFFGYYLAGFLTLALAAFAARFARTLTQIVTRQTVVRVRPFSWSDIQTLLIDGAIVGLMVFSVYRIDRIDALFCGVMMVGLLRLGASIAHRIGLAQLLDDRGFLTILLGVALGMGKLIPVVQVVAAGLLLWLVIRASTSRLTQT